MNLKLTQAPMSSITDTQPANLKHAGSKAEVPYSEMPLSFPARPGTAAKTHLTLECIYAQIRLVGFHQPNSPIDLSSVITGIGATRKTLLLPGGGCLPRNTGLGLGTYSSNPRLLAAFKDPDLNATWLKLAATNTGGLEVQSYVLLDNERSGKEALLKVYSPAQFNFYSAYLATRITGSFTPEHPLDLSESIQKHGSTQRTFLLPGGDCLSRSVGLGLREDISSPRLLGAFKDPELNATWLKLAATTKDGLEVQSYVLLDNERSGKEALLKVYSPAQFNLFSAYRTARVSGSFAPEPPLDLSELIQKHGKTQVAFLLPGGDFLIQGAGLGLREDISNPRLLNAFKDPDLNATWLKLAATTKDGLEVQSYVLLDNERSGKDALLKVYSPAQFNLYSAYRTARATGSFTSDPPIDISELIGLRGSTHKTFLLPGGDCLPSDIGLGLASDISSPRLLAAFKDPDINATWLKLAADKNGVEVQSYVLLDNQRSGKEALLKVYSPAQFNLYSAYRTARTTGSFTSDPPLDVSDLIQKYGKTQVAFLLPGGDTFGCIIGLGLAKDISNQRLLAVFRDPELNATWLKLAADKNGLELQSYVLLDNERSGKEALLKVYSPAQFNLYSAYRTARVSGSFAPEPPLDLSELIRKNGGAQDTFLLPGGDSIHYPIRLGLGTDISNPRLLGAFKDPELNATWLKLAATDTGGLEVQSYVLLDNQISGKDALLKVYSPAQFNLYSAYCGARITGSFVPDPPLALSKLIRKQGGPQHTFLLPGGDCLPDGTGLGLGKITAPKLHEVLLVKEGLYRLHITGTKPDGTQRSSYLLVNSSGIVSQGKSDLELAQLEKGRCFDRYLAHLVAGAKIEGLCAQEYPGSVLTHERFRPNISLTAPPAILHGKWGLDPQDVLDYARRYIRMSRWNKEGEAAGHAPFITFVLARDTKFAEIEEAFQSCEDIFERPLLLKTAAGWHSDLSKTSSSREIEVEIERIETLAAWGLVEDLKAKSYLPSLPYGSHAVAEESTLNAQSMRERVDKLLSPESIDGLIVDLDTHIETFSAYWEKAYHLELAAHCSYLLDSINEGSDEKTRAIAPAIKEQLKQRVLKLYPELGSYPGAWKVLLRSGEAQRGVGEGSAGGGSLVVEFNLEKELEARNAAKQQAPLVTASPSLNTLSLAPREAVLAELGQIKDPIQYTRMLLAATNGRPDKASFQHLAVEGFYRAALTASQNAKLTAALSEIRGSHSRADDFLNLLARLDADVSIRYQDFSTKKTKAIGAAELWVLFSQFR